MGDGFTGQLRLAANRKNALLGETRVPQLTQIQDAIAPVRRTSIPCADPWSLGQDELFF
jgi:hypothetical protein